MFRFDFSPYLSLKSEIKTNNNLVLIVRTNQENTTAFLRRLYLSGWDPKKGFFELKAPSEEVQLKKVPQTQTHIPQHNYLLRSDAKQDIFIINFDPNSLLAMDYPIFVTPYQIWNSAKFTGAYSVTSAITGFAPFELFDSPPPTGALKEGLTQEDLIFYTSMDNDTRQKFSSLTEPLTADISGYYDKVLATTAFLKEGEYRYSLKPGIASNGNQLEHFLFVSKKGYCTYFAFSLCLMLRSIHIPSRVSAGFFIQPDSGALDYYPIRANMAHAWVEVFFPHYGWISFDPTTNQIAPGEDILTTNNPGGDEFFNLLDEIIENRNLLKSPSLTHVDVRSDNSFSKYLSAVYTFASNPLVLIILIIIMVSFVLLRRCPFIFMRLTTNNRKKIFLLSKNLALRLALNGIKKHKLQSQNDFYKSLKSDTILLFYSMEQKAKFSNSCTPEEAEKAFQLYRAIKLPIFKNFSTTPFFIVAFLLCSISVYPQNIPVTTKTFETIEQLKNSAKEAISAENWESAITQLNHGINTFPEEPLFHYLLGNLYFDKGLYKPAYKELLLAKQLNYTGSDILSRLSDTAAYLNNDAEALSFIKKYLEIVPDDLYAWSNFGWLCYKTHNLDEGISSLHRILDIYGPEGNIYVSLGNLYTASFNYQEAKKNYTLAIQTAENRNQTYLASIYYYNRSILEEVFYNFQLAYDDTENALKASPRSSGYLMQGELELRRQNYPGALAQYQKAYILDPTPLATMGLVDTLLQAGHPSEAEKYLQGIQKNHDYSWISNYGTTLDQFKADLYELQTTLYAFRLNLEKRKLIHSFPTYISKQFQIFIYQCKRWFYKSLNRIENKKIARHYEKTEKELKGINGKGLFTNSFYFLALSQWRLIAKKYLLNALNIESQLIPSAKPSYMYELAKLNHDKILYDSALATLDPVWERKIVAKALSERILLTAKQDYALLHTLHSQLFITNPSSYIFYNLKLPVRFSSQGNTSANHVEVIKKLTKGFKKTGFLETENSKYLVRFMCNSDKITVQLIDLNSNFTVYAQDLPINSLKNYETSDFINNFSTSLFSSTL